MVMSEEFVKIETLKMLQEKGFNEYHYPTQSIAQKWLRETKNLHVLSIPKVVESYNKIGEVVKTEVEFHYWDIYVVGSNKPKHIIQNCFTNQFNTYEEALEAGIQRALELI